MRHPFHGTASQAKSGGTRIRAVLAPGADLDLNLHHLLHQPRLNHRRRGSNIPQPFLQHWPAERELLCVWQDVPNAHDIRHARAGLQESVLDVLQRFLGLVDDIWGDGAFGIVIPTRGFVLRNLNL